MKICSKIDVHKKHSPEGPGTLGDRSGVADGDECLLQPGFELLPGPDSEQLLSGSLSASFAWVAPPCGGRTNVWNGCCRPPNRRRISSAIRESLAAAAAAIAAAGKENQPAEGAKKPGISDLVAKNNRSGRYYQIFLTSDYQISL